MWIYVLPLLIFRLVRFSWLDCFSRLSGLVTRFLLVEFDSRENAVISSDSATQFLNGQPFNFRLVPVDHLHRVNCVDLVKISNFVLDLLD